jgi:hypothetical protein
MFFLVRFLLVLVLDSFLRDRFGSESIAWNDSSISSIAAHSKAEPRATSKNRLRRLQPWKTELKSEQNVSIAPSPIVY